MERRRWWTIAAAAAAVAYGGTAQAVTLTPVEIRAHGPGPFEGLTFGMSSANVGDLDADGVADYAVGAPYQSGLGLPDPGRVVVYSGATGAVLHDIAGVPGHIWLGVSVADAGDVDGDGTPDVIAGAGGEYPSYPSGAFVFSGATGGLIRSWVGGFPNCFGAIFFSDELGISVDGVGDIDGDGFDDLLVIARKATTSCGVPTWEVYPRIDVYSGQTGALLYSSGGFGEAMVIQGFGLGDVSGDATPDYAVAATEFISVPPDPGEISGRIRVYSGANGALLYPEYAVLPPPFGLSALLPGVVSDLDFDGRSDIVFYESIGVIGSSPATLRALSGSTGAVVLTATPGFLSSAPLQGLLPVGAIATSDIGDFDGDGRSDFVTGAMDVFAGSGAAHVLDGTGVLRYTIPGGANEALGVSTAGLGDLNGDGYLEFLATGFDVMTGDGFARVYTLVPPCVDADGDGWGANGSLDCPNPGVADCDDGNAAVNPGATEIPGNGLDDDCDATTPGGCIPPTTVPVRGGSAEAVPAALALMALGALAIRRAGRRRV